MKKKLFVVLLSSLLLVACSSRESLISKFEKACEKGDIEKAEKIGEKIDKKYGTDLTISEATRITKASMKLYGNTVNEVMNEYKKAAEKMEKAFNLDD